jgi:hypothetical protein
MKIYVLLLSVILCGCAGVQSSANRRGQQIIPIHNRSELNRIWNLPEASASQFEKWIELCKDDFLVNYSRDNRAGEMTLEGAHYDQKKNFLYLECALCGVLDAFVIYAIDLNAGKIKYKIAGSRA